MSKGTYGYLCNICSKSYGYKRNLKQHVMKKHPDKQNEVISLHNNKTYTYKCGQCTKQFNALHNLRYHEKEVHGVMHGSKLKCVLCDFETCSKKKLFEHLLDVHNVEIKCEELQFSSMEDFTNWKATMEEETCTKYVLKRGSNAAADKTVRHYYICQRTGNFVSKSKGTRNVKIQGSHKINGVCPANIRVFEYEDGTCTITHVPTHVCHITDIKHLLSADNKVN